MVTEGDGDVEKVKKCGGNKQDNFEPSTRVTQDSVQSKQLPVVDNATEERMRLIGCSSLLPQRCACRVEGAVVEVGSQCGLNPLHHRKDTSHGHHTQRCLTKPWYTGNGRERQQ